MQKKLHALSLLILFVVSGSSVVNGDDASSSSCALFDLPYPRPEPANYTGKLVRDFSPFSAELEAYTPEQAAEREALVGGKTIPELQAAMNEQHSNSLTSIDLVVYYLDRIQRYDVDKLNSVLELNPDALQIAQALDDEREAGNTRGPMHGIPVLLKDNIATGDDMHTAAGSAAMLGWDPDRDAFLVAQLRNAGAIILGKANLSEWANYMDRCMPNGFSANGGQTQNPYGPFETYGSSSGSAVSVAADLVTVSVGSETQGSIIMPSTISSVVALKTSRGLVSSDYIIPLLPWQDVAGPIGRTVNDVATLLSAMTGVDANDPNTQASTDLVGVDFSQVLNDETQVRVGIEIWTEDAVRDMLAALNLPMSDEELAKVFETYADGNANARATGAILSSAGTISVKEVPGNLIPGRIDVGPAIEYGFGQALDEFLTGLGDDAPFASLAEIVDFNKQDLTNRAPYGQGYLEGAVNTLISSEEYAERKENNQAQARDALDTLFESQAIDIIVSGVSQTYAPAGYPALTVPSGYDSAGTPESVVFVGGFMSEPQLLAVGYAFEQATKARVAPDLAAEPWKMTPVTPCTPCAPIEVCFLEDACVLRDNATGNWTGEAALCNDVAPPCEECFPDSPCYFGEEKNSIPSGSTSILSRWGLLLAGWMTGFLSCI